MNLPQVLADPSVLQHEPLRTHIALYEQCAGSRSQSNKVVSDFVKAMQKDDHAKLACNEWVYLTFTGWEFSRDNFGVADNGEKLYEAFFHFHLKLSRGNLKEVEEYRSHIVRSGIGLIRREDARSKARNSAKGKGRKAKSEVREDQHLLSGPMNDRLQAETERGNTEVTSSRRGQPRPGTDSSVSSKLATSPEAVKQAKRLTFKKEKKRKASSQKPPIITPSDVSEDEKKPSETQVSATSSISHREKRIATNPPCPPHKLCVAKNVSDRRADTSISQRSSSLRTFRSGNPVSGLKKGRRSAESPLIRRKQRLLDASKRSMWAGSKPRRLRMAKSDKGLPSRPRKRQRFSSVPADEREGVSTSTQARFLSEFILEKPVATTPPSTRNVRVEVKTRKKRTRREYEASSMIPREDAQVDYCETLGPDIRPLRPLPRKVRNECSVPVMDESASIRGVPCGILSLQHADQLLRDSAGNALIFMNEGEASDVLDWTQDKDQDAECDDPEDQDEIDDVLSVTPASVALVVTKPPVPAPPRIWALSRQEVCESFEHFRSYHSGVYSKDDIVKGYLLGAYAASRDIFHHGGKLIISHGGGKSESILDTRGGPKRFRTDQDQQATDKSVRALLRTWKERRPLVLLADDKYALFPYDLTSGNYTYVVLGLYWISHAWAECQSSRDGTGYIVRWKFAFQWCEGQGNPWWATRETKDIAPKVPTPVSGPTMCSTDDPSHLTSASESLYIQCESCQEQSPFVYGQRWMCLNPQCEKFWTIDGEEPTQLDYREEFLTLLPQKFERLPNIMPIRVVAAPGGVTTTFACSKGWHCMKCGRLTCRFKWEHWECSNCGFKHEVKGRERSPKEFWHQRPPKEFLHSRIGKESGIIPCRLEPIDLGKEKGFTSRLTFILPCGRGKIHLILGTPFSNEDADHIFQLYQQQASTGELKLRRYPLRNHRARGLLLTNYFSQNSGEPYQYVGGTGNTVPFDQAPECVQRALAVIKDRARLALHADIPFNEILSAAYMERQKMSFHSDSEKGLGPIVASLSLGSAALMHFRPHVNVGEPKGKSAYALTLVLRHGDVLIMEGDGVQKYYEHTVVPMNFRIAATARCIGST